MTRKECREKYPDFFLQRGSDQLVISIGDSWTWGDSLGNISLGAVDDTEARKNNCYGRIIADEIGADWLNFGFCGWGNSKILSCASDLVVNHHVEWLSQQGYNSIRSSSWPENVEIAKQNTRSTIYHELKTLHCSSQNYYSSCVNFYKKIYVFITLTETGRDIHHWGLHNLNTSQRNITFEDYFIEEERRTYQGLDTLIRAQPDITFIVARNFTTDYPQTFNSTVSFTKNWVEINWEDNQISGGNNNIKLSDILVQGPASGVAFKVQHELEDLPGYKSWFVEKMNYVDKLWVWLKNNPLHNNRATCHPNERGHRLWAEFLLREIDNV
jgi:hypothetical protein